MFTIDVEDNGSPRAALDIAGQGVRAFNHRTGERFHNWSDEWNYPADVYRCLGELTYLTGMLPQVFTHMMGSIHGQLADGHIAVDRGSQYENDPAAAIETACLALAEATRSARDLYRHIAEAQTATAPLSYSGPDLAN